MNRLGKVYGQRPKLLKEMGYSSYDEYLSSEQWAVIRREVLERQPNCELCFQIATQVHHASYTRESLRKSKSKLLVSICRPCHYYIEFASGGQKEAWSMSATKLLCKLTKLGYTERAAQIAKGIGRTYTIAKYSPPPEVAYAILKSVGHRAGRHWKAYGKRKK